MPTILNQETVDQIAQNYCSNGHNKEKAMKDAGYSKSYAETLGHSIIYSNIRVIEAIAKVEAENKAKVEHNREISLKNLETAYVMAREKNDISSMIAAEREKNAITGLHVQTVLTTSDQQRELDESQQQHAKELAILANKASIRLVKGA